MCIRDRGRIASDLKVYKLNVALRLNRITYVLPGGGARRLIEDICMFLLRRARGHLEQSRWSPRPCRQRRTRSRRDINSQMAGASSPGVHSSINVILLLPGVGALRVLRAKL